MCWSSLLHHISTFLSVTKLLLYSDDDCCYADYYNTEEDGHEPCPKHVEC